MQLLHIKSLDEIDLNANLFFQKTIGHKLFAFHGSMGSGKTTFIQSFCKALGVIDSVCSPTFAIINVYKTFKDEEVYHFDFYRLKNIEEAYDIGYEDYIYSGNICLMEWPEIIESVLPPEVLKINITVQDDNSRILSWSQ